MTNLKIVRNRSLRAPVTLSLLAALIGLAAPDLAEACSPPPVGLTSTTPADGETYPANAALIFQGSGISLAAASVAVDGAPAILVEVEVPGFPGTLARIDPQPEPGQVVTITGDFCESEDCEPIDMSFTAGPLDTDAPQASDLFFNAFDHGDFVSSGGDCMSDSDLSFYVHLDVAPQTPDQAPVRYRVVYDPDGEPGAPGFEEIGLFNASLKALPISVVTEQLGDVDATDLCIKVIVDDLAGNTREPIELCKPCFFTTSDSPQESSTPAEPSWSDADVVPGSACAAAGETEGAETGEPATTTIGDSTGDATTGDTTGDATTGDTTGEPPTTSAPTGTGDASESTAGEGTAGDTADQDDDDKGCSCRSNEGAGGPLALLAGMLALLGRRRRR